MVGPETLGPLKYQQPMNYEDISHSTEDLLPIHHFRHKHRNTDTSDSYFVTFLHHSWKPEQGAEPGPDDFQPAFQTKKRRCRTNFITNITTASYESYA